LPKSFVATAVSLRTLSEFDLDPRRCPGLEFANAFGAFHSDYS